SLQALEKSQKGWRGRNPHFERGFRLAKYTEFILVEDVRASRFQTLTQWRQLCLLFLRHPSPEHPETAARQRHEAKTQKSRPAGFGHLATRHGVNAFLIDSERLFIRRGQPAPFEKQTESGAQGIGGIYRF